MTSKQILAIIAREAPPDSATLHYYTPQQYAVAIACAQTLGAETKRVVLGDEDGSNQFEACYINVDGIAGLTLIGPVGYVPPTAKLASVSLDDAVDITDAGKAALEAA